MLKRKLNESISDNAQVTKQAKFMYHIILSDDGTLKYNFMTSLQNIVMAKIISSFWMNQDTQMKIVTLFRSQFRPEHHTFAEKWMQVENNIIIQVSELFLPISIIKRLKNIVPLIGKSLLNWIRYHDEYVLESDQFSHYSAVDFISHITWTARGKIEYAQTAKNILIGNASTLSNDHKYKIACNYCFLDEIISLSVTVVDKYYLDKIDVSTHPMVHFWTAHIRNHGNLYNPYYSLHYNPHNNISIYDHLMWLLLTNNGSVKRTFNEIPIVYVWNELSQEERVKYIASLIKQISNQDLVYSVLSNLDYEQQQEVFKKCTDSILAGILNNWLWVDSFLPTALQILDIMDPLSYLNVLEEIIKAKNKNSDEENKYFYHKFKSIFKELWSKGSRHLKDFIYEHKHGFSLAHLVMISLSWERDIDLVELILNDLTAEQRRNLIFGSHGINYCFFLIQNAHWNLLDFFIKQTLSYEDDVSQLKQIFSNEGKRIVLYFLDCKALDKIEHFMILSFQSEKERDEFRQNLPYTKICPYAFKPIISNNKVDFTELENYFKWCAKNSLELITKYKSEFLKCPTGEILIIELMEQYKYKLVDKVLSWCLSENETQISHFKCNLYKDDRYFETIRALMSRLIVKDNSFKLLETFICWNFTNEKEAQEFKTWLLYPLKTNIDILCSPCRDLLCECNFDLADKFISWCVTSSEEENIFKNEYMLSNDMSFILSTSSVSVHDLKLLIDWFDPSSVTVKKFKTIFFKNDCPHSFFNLLDDFIESK